MKANSQRAQEENASRTGGGRRRRWWFPLAALALPLLALVLIEGGLRLFGVGYATGFWKPARIAGEAVFVENAEFARRYFPAGMERTPEPVAIAAVKPPGTTRIFLFGESAAQGDPQPAFAVGRILEVLLGARYPERRFEVVNLAVTAINSHVIRRIAADCARQAGDVWVVYMGNNEVVGPYGAGTVFGARVPGMGFIGASLALRQLRLVQVLDDWRGRLAGRGREWAGMEMFLEQQVRLEDEGMAIVYGHFRENLEAILATAEAAGAGVLLCTVASNLKDCPPFASLHRPGLTPAERGEWERFFESGRKHEGAGEWAAAAAAYGAAAERDDTFAELWYRLGQCHYAGSNYADARECLERARDRDTLRFRADSRINGIIRDTAIRRAGRGVRLLDAVAAFGENSPHGIAGEELFHEHVHPNFEGHYVLARALAEQVPGVLAAGDAGWAQAGGEWLSAGECRARLAYSAWDRVRVIEEMCERLQLAPFTQQLDHTNRIQRWRERLALSEAALNAELLEADLAMYRGAIEAWPEDWRLRANFARWAQFNGHAEIAEREWRRVLEQMPHSVEAWYNLGNLLDRGGRTPEAIGYFEEALRRRPGLVEAHNGLGLALANLGKMEAAVEQYAAALRRRPTFAEAQVNLGQLLMGLGRVDEAQAAFETALRHKSGSAAAHINLGKLLAGQGKLQEAAAHYRSAIAAQPQSAVAYYNLGNALVALNHPDALRQYAAAVRIDPEFAEAHYNLGLGCARVGELEAALKHLGEAARLRPDSAEVQFNLGVALAKLGRYPEAAAVFRETLRIEPHHAAARKYLEQAERLGPQP